MGDVENAMIVTPAVTKKPWQSKTNWAALLVTLAAFIPGAQPIIAAHPEVVGIAVGGLFAFLRQISHGKIEL